MPDSHSGDNADKKTAKDSECMHQALKPKGPGGAFTRSADGRIIAHRKSRFRRQKTGGVIAWFKKLFS